ncbi:MAG: HD domain-containing protein [Thermoguttaceae bacterium]|nr:HD domain-containing protein [Thermoguttaceae bacterium]MDW8078369.1 HD domain-containing protein [Thermoguttaceae bacterium]
MTKRFVSQLHDQESVNEIFRATHKQLRPNRNGQLYLYCRLSDKTGSIDALLWNVSEEHYQAFEDGDYVRAEGLAQLYHGQMQIILRRITKVAGDQIDPADFFPLTQEQIHRLKVRLRETLREVTDPALATLVECFLIDDQFMQAFCELPAGVRAHHAYPGGLLEHVVTMLEMGLQAARCYPNVNKSLLLTGILVHDIGKLEELSPHPSAEYTDRGQLVGHVIIGIEMLHEKVRQAEMLSGEKFPPELLLRLEHIIASHHGEYEFGSPRLPMTLEALLIHHLDLMDSKYSAFMQAFTDTPQGDNPWSRFHPQLGRKLFRGSSPSRPGVISEC